MRYLPDGAWMQKADAHTIQNIGIPSEVLMERAALKTVEWMEEKHLVQGKILIVCGSGNNGGDGFAVARLLHQKHCQVTVVFVGKESSMSRECCLQAKIAHNLGISIVTELPGEEYNVIIDAVFGVGLSREISGHYEEVIRTLNARQGIKLAVDIPSGIDSKSGKVLGTAFRADATVTFQCEKAGTVLFPGTEYAGEVVAADIGIDTSIFEAQPEICYTLETEDVTRYLPQRRADSHKGSYGKVLMITGSKGMAGAAYLSAKAAYTCGAGLVQVYTHESNRVILQQLLPEAIISTYENDFAKESETLKTLLGWADVVCIGCGLGLSDMARALLEHTLVNADVPCVIDADGLNLLAKNMELLHRMKAAAVLTPHMKEMAGMLGCTVPELKTERFARMKKFVEQYPVVCVLKDSRSMVAASGKKTFLNTAGNCGMAKAGSGDVLAGVITAFLAQKMPAYESAVGGVFLHAGGGDEARRMCGSYSMLAEDLIEGIKILLRKTEQMEGEQK